MNFTEVNFLIFFILVLIGYGVANSSSKRKIWLLVSGYVFYGIWNWRYIPLLFGATLFDYFCARKIVESKFRKTYLVLSVLFNLLLLFTFKYFNFFAGMIGENLKIVNLIIPIGLSFYTFQSMSYTIDVYRDSKNLEKNVVNYLLFTSFFPQLVAGPIERANHLIPQLNQLFELKYENVRSGLQQILFGFFKKIVIADHLALSVDKFYSNIEGYNGFDAWISIFAYSIQIYFDFSSYTDIARGIAKIFNINLVENFNLPYLATSVSDFWKRWHMSLTNWFRDYLFYPLVFNEYFKINFMAITMFVFILSGFWHGANWTFLLWGAMNGIILIGESKYLNFFAKISKNNLGKMFLILINFIVLSFLWVLFRSESLKTIGSVFNSLLNINQSTSFLFKMSDLYLIFLVILSELVVSFKLLNPNSWLNQKLYFRWSFYILMIIMIVFVGEYKGRPYIYFQF